MKKYFLYELKKNLLPIVVLTVICCLIYVAYVLNARFVYYYPDGKPSPSGSLNWMPEVFLCVLCTIVPVMMFSFKMNRRVIDGVYSLPLKREKIYLIKSLVGLIMVFIPYITSYWLGFIVTACKEHVFDMVWFVPVFFISIPLAVLLFGINSFAFARANKVHDGILFIGLFALAAVAALVFVDKFADLRYTDFSYWFTYSPLVYTFSKYNSMINAQYYIFYYKYEWLLYLFGGLTGAACWTGLFIGAKTDKAEDAEQVSSSWFGYKTFIPFYMVLLFGLIEMFGYESIYIVLIPIGGLIAYIIYRQSFKLKKNDWLMLGIAIIAGIIFAVIPEPVVQEADPIVYVVSDVLKMI